MSPFKKHYHKGISQSRGKSKGRSGDRKWYYCGIERHFKINCKKRIQDEKKQKSQENINVAIASGEADFGEVLNVGTIQRISK